MYKIEEQYCKQIKFKLKSVFLPVYLGNSVAHKKVAQVTWQVEFHALKKPLKKTKDVRKESGSGKGDSVEAAWDKD
jgi:hypothetical protein